jgi:hypothetical protein
MANTPAQIKYMNARKKTAIPRAHGGGACAVCHVAAGELCHGEDNPPLPHYSLPLDD